VQAFADDARNWEQSLSLKGLQPAAFATAELNSRASQNVRLRFLAAIE